MGLLDKILPVGKGSAPDQNVVGGILDMINDSKTGGLEGLAGKFAANKMGNIVDSWISIGKNKPVNTSQLNNVLGGDMIKNLAGKLGVTPAVALKMLAKHLPGIVDKLTPDGKISGQAGAVNVQDILSKLMKK